jgi:pyruvate/2-oxoglutarate dehydrogenase complex dihydrolipoamide acyltransferase (E2) component
MIISGKQHEANRRNAQKSSGPVTEEGKAAIRFNALTFGLRTRATVLQTENVADYYRLYNELDAEWKPQTRTERCHVETMVTSQWLLARVARSEQRVYMEVGFGERQFALLAQVDKQRAHLERSFRTAIADMKQAQKERQARPQAQPAEPAAAPAPKPAGPQAPQPDYVMSEGAEAHPVFCAPATTDSR